MRVGRHRPGGDQPGHVQSDPMLQRQRRAQRRPAANHRGDPVEVDEGRQHDQTIAMLREHLAQRFRISARENDRRGRFRNRSAQRISVVIGRGHAGRRYGWLHQDVGNSQRRTGRRSDPVECLAGYERGNPDVRWRAMCRAEVADEPSHFGAVDGAPLFRGETRCFVSRSSGNARYLVAAGDERQLDEGGRAVTIERGWIGSRTGGLVERNAHCTLLLTLFPAAPSYGLLPWPAVSQVG